MIESVRHRTVLHAAVSRRGLVFALTTILIATSLSGARPSPDFAAIDRVVWSQLTAARVPGATLVIVNRDGLVRVKCFGVAAQDGRPVTATTPFVLGSTSKSFTALAVMQLVEERKITLDTPAAKYIPELLALPPEQRSRITIARLLNHTSGLQRADYWHSIRTAAGTAGPAMGRHVDGVREAALDLTRDARFHYANINYTILALTVERVSGMPFARYLKQHVFTPLQMTHTFAAWPEARAAGLADGYRLWFGHPIATDRPVDMDDPGAKSLITSGNDMAHWLSAHLNDGRFGDHRVVSADTMSRLHAETASKGGGNGYAMGWFTGGVDGVPMLDHPGNVANFASRMTLLPDSGWGMALLANVGGARADAVWDAELNGVRILLGRGAVTARGPSRYAVGLSVISIFTVAQLVAIFLLLRRGMREPAGRGGRLMLWITMALALSIAWLWIVPRMTGMPLGILRLEIPDAGALIVLNGLTPLASVVAFVAMNVSGRRRRSADRKPAPRLPVATDS